MKKALAALMLAAMMLSVGCGNNAMDGAKKDAQEAAQKVEQKADEVKKDAEAKVDEVKDAANQAADNAAAKADEVKDAATQAADNAAAKVDEVKDDVSEKLDDVTAEITQNVEGRTVALNGIMPGTSLEDLEATFGSPADTQSDVLTFVNGLKVKLDDAKKVKEISTTGADFNTPEGMYVGASEYLLNDYCGMADAVRQISGGAEYEYNSGDKKSKVVYKAQNGIITEIICSLK
ncbi:MAG: hypothetical protein IKT98_11080 [Selenomonadaceae bacterium]|nr:hypothetical protein [Selenomonadaceae bacterium]